MMNNKLPVVLLSCLCLAVLWIAPSTAEETVFAAIKVEFDLVDRNGVATTYEEFRGKNVLLAFGFTHCLHICPMVAAKMAAAIDVAEKDSVGVFISVDTERDSPAITDDYAKKFGAAMTGLSGSHAQVAAVANNFNATFVVTKSEDAYTVQHTPGIFLISPDGELIDVFPMNTAADKIAQAMQ
jgi:protein SCO1/2